jgi:16S rRNA (guanine966-N2)-methyltransferase
VPKGDGTRPTTDRVRESLFNSLEAHLDFTDLVVVDLYAGSGALGLEALSRGATSALFVESDRRAADVIAANVRELGAAGAAVRNVPVVTALTGRLAEPAELVFADPPYEMPTGDVEAVLRALETAGWVADGAVAVVERAATSPELSWPGRWSSWRTRRYGDTRLEFGEFA